MKIRKVIVIGLALVMMLLFFASAFLYTSAAPSAQCSEECPDTPTPAEIIRHERKHFCNNAILVKKKNTLYWNSSALGSFAGGNWDMQSGAFAVIYSPAWPNGFSPYNITWDGENSYHASVSPDLIVDGATLVIVDKWGYRVECEYISVQ